MLRRALDLDALGGGGGSKKKNKQKEQVSASKDLSLLVSLLLDT